MAPTRRTTHDVYELIQVEVLPRLARVETLTTKNQEILKSAGLSNGSSSAPAVKQFFDERAAHAMVREAVISPLRKTGRALLLIIGTVSALAWAAVGILNISRTLSGH